MVLHSLSVCLLCIWMLLCCLSRLSLSFIFFAFSISLGKGKSNRGREAPVATFCATRSSAMSSSRGTGSVGGGLGVVRHAGGLSASSFFDDVTFSGFLEELPPCSCVTSLVSLSSLPSFFWQSEFLSVRGKKVEVRVFLSFPFTPLSRCLSPV